MLCEDSLNPAERRYVVRLDGDRFCPSLFEECCCRPTDFRISLLYRVLRTVATSTQIAVRIGIETPNWSLFDIST
ncbi:hypothetical protein BRC71_04295 [Halobacteriales archaeon QH_7_65_31]|nr:MAG: hypothetical protein BRC71_04295 [Halobacteriales archaeon QH_7_65_31]